MHWRIGGVDVSLLEPDPGRLSAIAVLLLVLWISAAIESRLLKDVVGSDISRPARSRPTACRALLLVVGMLVALSAAGIPMSALSVMGGAVGVGIGLGLQKLAANYVSGFVILAERSLRIGDLVKVDNFEGHVTDIKTRYTVIRALSGRESIVPNEMLITQRVENSSPRRPQCARHHFGDGRLRHRPADADAAPGAGDTGGAARAGRSGAGIQLSAFLADGLELTLCSGSPIPRTAKAARSPREPRPAGDDPGRRACEIPFPQRVLRRTLAAQPPAASGLMVP